MSRCINCQFAQHDQFKGYPGRWMCFHPYRTEISNSGHFTYPGEHNPRIVICETAAADYGDHQKHSIALADAKTPVWCYLDAVDRAKQEQPGFDPDVQRAILWPEKIGGLDHGR